MKLPVRGMCYAEGLSLGIDIANSSVSRMTTHPNVDKGKDREATLPISKLKRHYESLKVHQTNGTTS
jgi:hypothetical protein